MFLLPQIFLPSLLPPLLKYLGHGEEFSLQYLGSEALITMV